MFNNITLEEKVKFSNTSTELCWTREQTVTSVCVCPHMLSQCDDNAQTFQPGINVCYFSVAICFERIAS